MIRKPRPPKSNVDEYRAHMREYRRQHVEEYRARARKPETLARANERRIERRREDPEWARLQDDKRRERARIRSLNRTRTPAKEKRLKKIYGLTLSQLEQMKVMQDHKCAICCRALRYDAGVAGMHIDHCHTTGNVRGLLCAQCNRGLGMFYDNPLALRHAADYVLKHLGMSARKPDRDADGLLSFIG